MVLLSIALRMLRLNLIGTSDMVSVPPAMTASAWPVAIIPIAWEMATFDEMQASVTVCAGVESRSPAPSIACKRSMEGLKVKVPGFARKMMEHPDGAA